MDATKATLSKPSGPIIAEGVSEDDFLTQYLGVVSERLEWVEGAIIDMSPVLDRHIFLGRYLENLFELYLEARPIGQMREDPTAMRMPDLQRTRQPDVMLILGDNQQNLTPTAMIGAADVCVEIVSDESVTRDYGEKRDEYERAGVREYWIVDPRIDEATFLRRNEDGLFSAAHPVNGVYTTPLLPDFRLSVARLWQKPLPTIRETLAEVDAMLAESP